MAIRVISPVNLDEGHLVALTADGKMDETKAVIGGQVVKLVESTEAAYGGEPHIEASKKLIQSLLLSLMGLCIKLPKLNPQTTYTFLSISIKPR